ncbi:MAG: phage tail protein [Pseudomonadota bacterium]
MEVPLPPVAFHFTVVIAGAGSDGPDAAFQEVGGLEQVVETETVVEGGENRFVHRLPKPAASPNLTLKRGLAAADGPLATWCKATLENDFAERIEPRDVVVSLLDAEGDPVATWSCTNAWPVKWAVAGFDAAKNALAMETVELSYNVIKRKA